MLHGLLMRSDHRSICREETLFQRMMGSRKDVKHALLTSAGTRCPPRSRCGAPPGETRAPPACPPSPPSSRSKQPPGWSSSSSCAPRPSRALQVRLLRGQSSLLVGLLRRLVLHVLRVRRAVHGRLARKLVERFLRLGLRRLRVRLKAGEVRLDHLEHANHTTALGLHARVGLIEDLRLLLALEKRRRLRRLLVELLQHRQRLSDRGLGLHGVLNRLLVRRLLLRADGRRLSHRLVDLRDLGRKVRDLLRQLRDRRAELVDLRMKRLDSRRLLLAGLLVRRQLRVAPALVLSLLVRLLHQAHDEVLDHLLHLHERILRNADRKRRQHTAVDRRALLAEELSHAGLARVLRAHRQLKEGHRRLLLDERRQILVGVAGNRAGRQNLDRLVDRGQLVRAELLALLEIRGLLRALRHEVVEVGLVRIAGGRRVREVALVLRGLLELRRLLLRLRLAVLSRRLDLRSQVLNQHLVRMASVALLLLEVRALVLELVLQLLEHVNDARRLELVGVRLRGRNGHRVLAELIPLRQESADHLLRVLRDQVELAHPQELRAVVRLLLQRRDRALERVDRLGVVLVRRQVVRVLHLAHLRRRLLVALVDGDVLIQLRNLLRERRGISLGLLDRSDELLHLCRGFLDRALLLNRGIIAELLVRRKLNLLLVLFLLSLLSHPLEELDDLLYRRHFRRRHQGEQHGEAAHAFAWAVHAKVCRRPYRLE